MDRWMDDLIGGLREGRAADVAGSRAALDVSLSEALLNRIIAERLPPGGPVRDLRLRLVADEALITLRLERPRFLPPMTVKVTIERQPDLPGAPDLVLRLGLPAGLGMLAGIGANLFATLPPGVRLDGDRLTLDLARLLAEQDLGWTLRYARALVVTFEPGRVRVQGSAAVE
jgi:hypothetical protein